MGPKTRYAKNGEVHIAYRVIGDGPRDLILVPGTISHVELFWGFPVNAYLLNRLSSFARVIVFDKRGQGLSDRVADQTIEERVDDLGAVLAAVGSKRVMIYGWSEGGQLSLTFAAQHPERVAGLMLYGTYPSMRSEPWNVPPERFESFLTSVKERWGEGILAKINAPSRIKDKAFMQWFGRLERAVASPASIVALMRANYELDVRGLLSSIRVPTLVLHRAGDSLVPAESGRYLARQVPGARYFELPGNDHLLQAFDFVVLEMLIDQIENFATGSVRARDPREILGAQGWRGPVESWQATDAVPIHAERASLIQVVAELEHCRKEIVSGQRNPREFEGLIARAQALIASDSSSWEGSESQLVTAIANFQSQKMDFEEARTAQICEKSLTTGGTRRDFIEKLDSAIAACRRRCDETTPCAGEHNGRSGPDSRNRMNGAGTQRPRLPESTVFRRQGDYWTISWQGKLVHLKDAKGFRYISYLLANAGCEVSACEMAATVNATGSYHSASETTRTRTDLGDAGVMLDATACKRYRHRIRELREELSDAEKCNDIGRATRLRWELEQLTEQLATAVGLRGRARKAGSHRERARLMVTKAIKAALAKLNTSHATLGHHLGTCIKTGNFCIYEPGPERPEWRL